MGTRKRLNEKIVSLQKRLPIYNSRCEINSKRFCNNKHQTKRHNKLYKEFVNEVVDLWSQQIADACNKSIMDKLMLENGRY